MARTEPSSTFLLSWLPKKIVKGLFEDQGILHNVTIGTWVTLSHFTVQKEPLHTIRQNPWEFQIWQFSLFSWSALYPSCQASARPAIISPSPATDWPTGCGHPFVSFQMTIKMGRGQADWKSSNISVQPASPGIGNPPPLLLQIPLKLLSSLWFTTVPVVDFLNVIWAISRQKLNRIAASDRLFTPISIRKAMQIEIVVFLFWDIGPQPYYWLWCRQQNRLQTPSLHDPQIPQHRPQISADESVHPYSMHPLNTFSIITSHVCFQILPYLLFLFATPYLFPYQQKN